MLKNLKKRYLKYLKSKKQQNKESKDLKNEGNILRELILKKIFEKDKESKWGNEITKKNYDNNLSPFIKKLYKNDENDLLMLNQMRTRVLQGYLQSIATRTYYKFMDKST